MAITYELINAYTVVGSSTSSITMSAIPNSYAHLIINISSRVSYAGPYHLNSNLQVNSQSTASSYAGRFLYPNPPSAVSAQSSTPTNIWISGANDNGTNYFSNNWSMIGNYNDSSGVSSRPYFGVQQALNGTLMIFGKAQPGTAEAITSLTFKELSNNNFVAGSTFYLYGLKNT
jgi:hypothetical protein